MMKPHVLSSRSIVVALKLFIIACAVLVAYQTTHGEIHRLSRAIAMQQRQLQQQQQWVQRIDTAKPVVHDGAQFTWQLGEWSEALNLALTLQPLTHDNSILTAQVTGDEMSITQLLKLSRDLSRKGAWKNVWASQLLGWKRLKNGSARLHWQLTTDLQNNVLKQRLVGQPAPTESCLKKPSASAITHPPFGELELHAVLISDASKPVAYWQTLSKRLLRTTAGDQFGPSGDVLAAIFTDHIIINEWQLAGDCWLLQTRKIEL